MQSAMLLRSLRHACQVTRSTQVCIFISHLELTVGLLCSYMHLLPVAAGVPGAAAHAGGCLHSMRHSTALVYPG